MPKIEKLDLIRGVAALIVIMSHYQHTDGRTLAIIPKGLGQIGVMFFFILSGFLMGYLYLSKEFIWVNIKTYLVSRAARVLPLYYFVIFSSFILIKLDIPSVGYNIGSWSSLAKHVFCVYGVSVLWTIVMEVKFYLLFVLFWWGYSQNFFFLRNRFQQIMFALIFFLFLWNSQNENITEVEFLFVLPYFLFGLILSRMYMKLLRYSSRPIWYSAVVIFVLLIVYMLKENNPNQPFSLWLDICCFLLINGLFFTFLFLTPHHLFFSIRRIGQFLASISYGVYLFHLPLMHLWNFLDLNVYLKLSAYLISVLVFASFSLMYYEFPVRKKINYLIK